MVSGNEQSPWATPTIVASPAHEHASPRTPRAMVALRMRRLLTPRLALLATAHFTIDAYSSFFPPLLPLLMQRLDLSLTRVGALVAIASLASSFSQPLFGLLSDRVRRPWFVAIGPLIAAAFLASVGRAPSFGALVALLMLGGLGVAAFHPQAAVLAAHGEGRRSLAMSVFITGGTLGFALGPLYAVTVTNLVGLERSWIAMAPGLLLGAVLFTQTTRLAMPARAIGARPALSELRPVLRPLLLLYFAVVCRSAVSYGFMTLLPIHLHARGYSVATGGLLVTAYLGLGALGGFAGGWLAERVGGRRVVVISFAGAAPLFAAFLALPDRPGLVCLVLGSFVLQASLPVNVVLGQELAPRHSSTISSLLMGAAWGVGALLISPIGALADHRGLPVALTTLSTLLVAGLVCALRLPRQPQPHAGAAASHQPLPGGVDSARFPLAPAVRTRFDARENDLPVRASPRASPSRKEPLHGTGDRRPRPHGPQHDATACCAPDTGWWRSIARPAPSRRRARTAPCRAHSLAEVVRALAAPRAVWLMIPAGQPVDDAIDTLLPLLAPGDLIVDGGNSNYQDSKRRAARVAAAGLLYADAGTSGRHLGPRERLLHHGWAGPTRRIARLKPALDSLAPPDGWRHVGPAGAGHFSKMIHNGIEYGMMQSYAEGFEILQSAASTRTTWPKLAHLWNQGSVVRSWLLELAERAFTADPALEKIRGYVRGLGGGALDRAGGDRPRRARRGAHALAAQPVPLAPGRLVPRPRARGAAPSVRRPRGEGEVA